MQKRFASLMLERGVALDYTTLYRWVQAHSPEIDKRYHRYLKPTNDFWRGNETYIKIKGVWKYLYRAVDSEGNTLDFLLTAKRNANAAKRFLRKVLNASNTIEPRVITVDKNAAYLSAIAELKAGETLPGTKETMQSKYFNNLVEQDHRFIKRLTKAGLGFGSFNAARWTLKGYEAMNMIRRAQIKGAKRDVIGHLSFINQIFGWLHNR